MTDLDELDAALASEPIAPPTFAGAAGRPKCWRHDWERRVFVGARGDYYEETVCRRPGCHKVRDEVQARRGRNNRKRGNRLQAKANVDANIQNVGPLGLPEDGGNSTDWLRTQSKSGKGYPRRLDRWLRAITVTATQLRGVVYIETPGPGQKARRLIVLDYDEFLDWYGPVRERKP